MMGSNVVLGVSLGAANLSCACAEQLRYHSPPDCNANS